MLTIPRQVAQIQAGGGDLSHVGVLLVDKAAVVGCGLVFWRQSLAQRQNKQDSKYSKPASSS